MEEYKMQGRAKQCYLLLQAIKSNKNTIFG